MAFGSDRDRQVVKKAELSLTPMIDVVFLLLIFFMVGMKFKEVDRKLETDLPSVGRPEEDAAPPEHEIHIRFRNFGRHDKLADAAYKRTRTRHITVDQVPMKDLKAVGDKLRQLLSESPKKWQRIKSGSRKRKRKRPTILDDPIILDPGDNVPHEWVLTVLGLLHKINVKIDRRKETFKFTNISFQDRGPAGPR